MKLYHLGTSYKKHSSKELLCSLEGYNFTRVLSLLCRSAYIGQYNSLSTWKVPLLSILTYYIISIPLSLRNIISPYISVIVISSSTFSYYLISLLLSLSFPTENHTSYVLRNITSRVKAIMLATSDSLFDLERKYSLDNAERRIGDFIRAKDSLNFHDFSAVTLAIESNFTLGNVLHLFSGGNPSKVQRTSDIKRHYCA